MGKATLPEAKAIVQDALSRVAVVVVELENGETSIAYIVAAELELDLEAVLANAA